MSSEPFLPMPPLTPTPDPVVPDSATSHAALVQYLSLFARVPRDEVFYRLVKDFQLVWPDTSGQTGYQN